MSQIPPMPNQLTPPMQLSKFPQEIVRVSDTGDGVSAMSQTALMVTFKGLYFKGNVHYEQIYISKQLNPRNCFSLQAELNLNQRCLRTVFVPKSVCEVCEGFVCTQSCREGDTRAEEYVVTGTNEDYLWIQWSRSTRSNNVLRSFKRESLMGIDMGIQWYKSIGFL